MNEQNTYILASLKPSDMNFPYKAKLIQQANFTWQPSSLFICGQYISRVPIKTDVLLFTGKSISEALILTSTNPQYDGTLFIELQARLRTWGDLPVP